VRRLYQEVQSKVIKIVVNAPKGGVGKTTVAMNAALHLARCGRRVWALDLAQSGLMARQLRDSGIFGPDSPHRIEEAPLSELPLSFPGSKVFDYLVVDTDDYYKILDNLLDPNRRGWRILTPMIADDYNGLQTIPDTMAELLRGALFLSVKRPRLRILLNRCRDGSEAVALEAAQAALDKHGIASFLSAHLLPEIEFSMAPYFVDAENFAAPLTNALKELEI
jgi:chromosome partitioning protein